jgi:hypothetical protein
MAGCILFVEGGSNTANGNLRQGFQKLLEQEKRLHGKMPRIEMSDSTAMAVKKFKSERDNPRSIYDSSLLLVDLDGPEEIREAWLTQHDLLPHREQVFFMVQEMEAWFLSQPDALHAFYRPPLPHALPKAAPARVPHPAQALAHCTKDHRPKGTYHKTGHGAQLLELLSLTKLQADFSDVARLVAAL